MFEGAIVSYDYQVILIHLGKGREVRFYLKLVMTGNNLIEQEVNRSGGEYLFSAPKYRFFPAQIAVVKKQVRCGSDVLRDDEYDPPVWLKDFVEHYIRLESIFRLVGDSRHQLLRAALHGVPTGVRSHIRPVHTPIRGRPSSSGLWQSHRPFSPSLECASIRIN